MLERWKCAARLDCHQASVRLLGCMYEVLVCAPYILMFALILCISRDMFLGADKGYYAYCPSISQPWNILRDRQYIASTNGVT